MPNVTLSPAELVYKKFGSAKKAAQAIGLAPSTAARWNHDKERGGSAGIVPQRHHQPLVLAARERGIKLRLEDFIDARSR